MDQTEFQRALKKFENRKKKVAQAALAEVEGPKVNTALPFAEIKPKAKVEKPAEEPRPRPKALEITVSGPIDLKLSIDWSGTLMGGQMNEQTMRTLFIKALSSMGRVR